MIDAIDYLTGQSEATPAPFATGRKFTPDGSVLPCPGNTTLCHVAPGSAAHAALVDLQDALKAAPFANCFTYLPPASFHMTIFEGVIDYARVPDRWPRDIALDASVNDVTSDLLARLDRVSVGQEFRVRPTGLFGGFSLRMSGADSAEEARLRSARDALRDATQILRPDHASYAFHITLGYLLRWITPKEAADVEAAAQQVFAQHARHLEISLGPIEFCRFETMHRFECLKTL